jgi:serine/threonine protein kinase
LVEGGVANEGRVEIFEQGVWQSVCDSSWDLRDGDVVCRELGYGYAVRVVGSALFGEGTGLQWKVDVYCSDNETELKYCEYDSLTKNRCTHSEDAGAICSTTELQNGSLRLADSGSVHSSHLYAGRLEVYSDESWGTVCNAGWGMNEANVACRQMGFVRATHSYWPHRTDGDDTQAISWYDVKCTGNESLLIECRHVASNESLATCVHNQDVGIRCTRQTLVGINTTRLVGGSVMNEGRVEVFRDGEWQSLCGDSWDTRDGDVVCRQLGYAYAIKVVRNALFGEGINGQWKTQLKCLGTESSTEDCCNRPRPCSHKDYAGVICSLTNTSLKQGALRMIDKLDTQSAYLYSGRLEVYINGTWGTICSDGWTINEANVACRQMGFVRATPEDWSYNDTSSVSNKEMLLGHVNCTGNESHLMDCIHNRFPTCGNKIEVGIRCTRQRIEKIESIHPSTIDPTIPLVIAFGVAGFSATLCFALLVILCLRKRCRILQRRQAQKVLMMRKAKEAAVKMSNNECSIDESTLQCTKDTVMDEDEWEMKYCDLQIQGHLGSGQFGDVSLAFLTNPACTTRVKSYFDRMCAQGDSLSLSCAVAMKSVKDDIPSHERQIFLKEIELMKKVSTTGNNHIVQLIGCILSKAPMAMIMEYSPFGDLHSNLLMWKEQGNVCPEDVTNTVNHLYLKEGLTDEDLMSFAHQISIGMAFLASLNVIHRDLACRNVLIGYGKILKIADFGLSKEIDGLYISSSHTRLPIRWMAPEAITHRLFSEKSDVWSYGVCLWEMCTLGEVPYGYISNKEVAKAIASGDVLEKPDQCTLEIYELMQKCWIQRSKERPTFKEIKNYLEKIIEAKLPNKNYIDITVVSTTTGEDPLKVIEISPSVNAE